MTIRVSQKVEQVKTQTFVIGFKYLTKKLSHQLFICQTSLFEATLHHYSSYLFRISYYVCFLRPLFQLKTRCVTILHRPIVWTVLPWRWTTCGRRNVFQLLRPVHRRRDGELCVQPGRGLHQQPFESRPGARLQDVQNPHRFYSPRCIAASPWRLSWCCRQTADGLVTSITVVDGPSPPQGFSLCFVFSLSGWGSPCSLRPPPISLKTCWRRSELNATRAQRRSGPHGRRVWGGQGSKHRHRGDKAGSKCESESRNPRSTRKRETDFECCVYKLQLTTPECYLKDFYARPRCFNIILTEKKSHLRVNFVAFLELSIISHDLHHQTHVW